MIGVLKVMDFDIAVLPLEGFYRALIKVKHCPRCCVLALSKLVLSRVCFVVRFLFSLEVYLGSLQGMNFVYII